MVQDKIINNIIDWVKIMKSLLIIVKNDISPCSMSNALN